MFQLYDNWDGTPRAQLEFVGEIMSCFLKNVILPIFTQNKNVHKHKHKYFITQIGPISMNRKTDAVSVTGSRALLVFGCAESNIGGLNP